VMNGAGKIVMECLIETKASMILQFIDGLRGDVHITFEEGTWASWLYNANNQLAHGCSNRIDRGPFRGRSALADSTGLRSAPDKHKLDT
jgi:hypothetical protein